MLACTLHTWNGQLGYHPHVHLLITGGGITADGQDQRSGFRGKFLVPVFVLSRKVAAALFARVAQRHRSSDRFRQRAGERLAAELGFLLQALRSR